MKGWPAVISVSLSSRVSLLSCLCCLWFDRAFLELFLSKFGEDIIPSLQFEAAFRFSSGAIMSSSCTSYSPMAPADKYRQVFRFSLLELTICSR